MFFNEVKEIVLNILGVEEKEIKPEAAFVENLGADSLDTIEIIMAIEEKFNIVIPDEEVKKIRTIQEAIEAVKKQISDNR